MLVFSTGFVNYGIAPLAFSLASFPALPCVNMYTVHKVLTYAEYRAVSGVFSSPPGPTTLSRNRAVAGKGVGCIMFAYPPNTRTAFFFIKGTTKLKIGKIKNKSC
jgi:hypothetical protein